jgi:hypothetical protein
VFSIGTYCAAGFQGQKVDGFVMLSDTVSNDIERDKVFRDSSDVDVRAFDDDIVNELKSDSALQYKEAPTVAESLWDRLKMWIRQLLEAIFNGAVTTNWGRLIVYLLGLAAAVAIILMILKVNAYKVFNGGNGPVLKQGILDEDIHALDFEKLIQDAVTKSDYRAGVRLIFLYSLKKLSDKNLIYWNQGKTNHDYLDELTIEELKIGFSELNFYFEYAWYGDFRISPEVFSKVQRIFNDWKQNL